jgi:hypothetical protein
MRINHPVGPFGEKKKAQRKGSVFSGTELEYVRLSPPT